MNSPQFSIGRVGAMAFAAVFVAIALLKVWMWTAPFPWSSDWWIELIPQVIAIAGYAAVMGFVLLLLIRRKKSGDD